MAPPHIYHSLASSVVIPDCSIFTHLFNSKDGDEIVGGYPGHYPAIVDSETGTTLTRKGLKDTALSFAYGLRNHRSLGLKRGDTVLVFAPNSFAWPVLLFGILAAGLKATLANSAYTAAELAFQFQETSPKLVITAEETLKTVVDMFKQLDKCPKDKILVFGPGLKWAGGPDIPANSSRSGHLQLEDVIGTGRLDVEEKFDGPLSEELALICFSSGTSGTPKGVMTSHKNLVSNICQTPAYYPPLRPKDKLYGILPFYHIYGCVVVLQYVFNTGATLVIGPRFDPVSFCANIEKYKINASLIVPPVLVVLAHHPVVSKYDMSSLDWLLSGAAPLGADLVKKVSDRLSTQNNNGRTLRITQGYGLTETTPIVHILPIEEAERKVGSIGQLIPNCQVRIVDENGKDVKEGEPGELWVRGPNVMKGYLNRPDATSDCMTKDGFFKTGDIATRDSEGFYYIVDRVKELIKYKGFQVPPAELESVLLSHPSIVDVAVIGIQDDEQATELPRAYVVADGTRSAEEKLVLGNEVMKWMEGKVAKHKYLRGGVEFVDVIPKSAAGKILRRELREKAKKDFAVAKTSQVKAKL
ncbi:AMP binding protein, partial [Flagelloscypha sp. PMI_526]